MTPTLDMDLTRSLTPLTGNACFGTHGDLPMPEGEIDATRGLLFPLTAGGFMLASDGLVSDVAGTLRLVFAPATDNPSGALIQAWGQYPPLIELVGEGLRLNIYGTAIPMLVRFVAKRDVTLRFCWHHLCGFVLSIKPRGQPEQVLRRRLTWRAFGQRYVPFSVGGMATAPRFRQWTPTFAGSVAALTLWDVPLDTPGPVQVDAVGAAIRPPFEPVPEVKVLALDDPPIRPDPLGLTMLPQRSIADLRRTREVAELERILGKCKSEREIFAMLTWTVGTLWPHCNYWPWPAGEQRWIFWKRGHELLPDIRAGRTGGMCGGYAHVMEELFWSLGFDARRIQVRGHSSFEAHSNELDRWIICDASYNEQCHMLADGQGQFLGAADIIRRHEALEHDPQAFRDVRQMLCREENLLESAPSAAANPMYGPGPVGAYDHLGVVIDKTQELGQRQSACRTARMAWYFRACERAWARHPSMGTGDSEPIMVKNLADLTPSRNRVRASLRWETPGKTLAVSAEPVGVTFFDTCLAACDGGAENPVEGTFAWPLHPGVNELTVRTRNQLGVRGYPFQIRLWAKP